ncbi:IclR family transcriptional regulator [Variovorax sp. PBL-E5]|uniref:IclR family transcriptional regulator n=1 Tax=Variovorax sp. PBL-E5 TaxID=434014 RepID=UPI001317BED8|nr:IclR family transcriptional regulator [Variovorax sp. PBL-E5]VTU38663.1 Acetate operon repressor [Variovorax sp. PBL-E5]
MLTTNLQRGLAMLDLLCRAQDGLPMFKMADPLGIPRSTAHRVLAELSEAGFVTQENEQAPYRLTLKLAQMGMSYLNVAGVTNVIQPVLHRLAAETKELARMSIVDGKRLVWVSKVQGSRTGLRYDANAEPGEEVVLFSSATGHAWLATLPENEALEIVMRQGFDPENRGPNAPKSATELLELLAKVRRKGYALVHETNEHGISAVAAPVWNKPANRVVGVVTIAGPTSRMDPEKIEAIAQQVLASADELSKVSFGLVR